MLSMKFEIDNKIFEKFPELSVGVLVCHDIDNKGEVADVMELIRAREAEIREQFDAETLSQHPKIDVWRQAYWAFGAKPKENKSSIENLYRRILKGEEIRHINKLVDIYNYISIKYMAPVGGEDLDKIKGDICLTFAKDNEPAVLLLGDKEARVPHSGEVIYKDEAGAICRRFNWREADRTKFTEATKNAILVVEGLPPSSKEDIENILKDLQALVQKFCKGKIAQFVLDKQNPAKGFRCSASGVEHIIR